jgi:hypothetical protein
MKIDWADAGRRGRTLLRRLTLRTKANILTHR